MTIRRFLRAQAGERAIDLLARDGAALDVDQTMGVTSKKTDDAVFDVNGDAIAVVIIVGRGDDWTQRQVADFPDSF